MKNILILFAIISGITGLSSCSKFLQENPKSVTPEDAYFQTTQQATSAVSYLYNINASPGSFFNANGVYDGTYSFAFDNMSGMSNNFVVQNPGLRYFSFLTQTPEGVGNYLGAIWDSAYSAIARSNSIILKVQGNANIATADQNSLLATAKYFRAINYYYLVRLFGAVPLILQPYQSADNLYAPRSAVDSVYGAIENDLNWALNNGGLADKPMGSNGNLISKGTVEVVLAEVYLTMAGYPLQKGADYYNKALTMASSIINSPGGYALFDYSGGTTPFDKLRLPANDQGSEYLYFIEYNAAIQQSTYPEWTLPNSFPRPLPNSSLNIQYTLTTGAWTPSTQLLNLYDSANDIRRHDLQFFHSSFTYQSTATGLNTTVNFPILPYRWFDSVAIFSTGASGKYTAVYRVADAYLIAAEAANEVNQDPTPYISPIINRAYVNVPAVPASQSDRRNFILAERYRELAMEGHCWFDMVRTRLYPDANSNNIVTFSPLIGHSNGRGQFYGNKDILMPLPPQEMQKNPALTPQNPGY